MEITIKFWEVDGYDVDNNHLDNLMNQYNKQVSDAIKKGFKSGELRAISYPMDDKMYTGYWEVTK